MLVDDPSLSNQFKYNTADRLLPINPQSRKIRLNKSIILHHQSMTTNKLSSIFYPLHRLQNQLLSHFQSQLLLNHSQNYLRPLLPLHKLLSLFRSATHLLRTLLLFHQHNHLLLPLH